VLQNEKLIKNRIGSSCGLIKGKDGSPVVAIIGGVQTGMELWNTKTGKVELLWEEIPPEVGGLGGLRYAEMLPIKNGSELIVYGGIDRSDSDEIWKYSVENNNWTKYFSCYNEIFAKL